jgi:superfamily I DNA and/or RNA helicase
MMLANDITFQRRRDAITNLRKNQQVGETTRMVNVLFHGLPPCQAPPRAMPAVPAERRLNESQEAAIEMGLRSQDVAVIHGPPGTGKTTTVLELIRRAVQNGEKVLACAPSNIAVDNMVERLAALKVNVVRVGHPARLLPEVLEYSLDALCASGDAAAILKDVRKDMDLTLKKSEGHCGAR